MAKGKRQVRQQSNRAAGKSAAARRDIPGWLFNKRLQALFIFTLAVLLYANTLTHEYAQDDAIVLTENAFTQEGISGIPGILRHDTFYGYFQEEGKANLVAGGRYRPLSLIMMALEVELFGMHPMVHHLINVLLYGLTALVLYWLLLQLLRAKRGQLRAFFIALATTLLFTAHPLHTEVVANIKGRDEILALLGSLAALSISIKAFRQKSLLWNLSAAVVFLLALFSKENAVAFVAVIPLAYYFFTKARPRTIVKQSLPFLAVVVLYLVVRGAILGWQLQTTSSEMMNNPFIKVEDGRYLPFTSGEKLATVTYTLGKYLQLLLVPHSLTHDYYPRQIEVMSWSDWQVWLSLILYALLMAYAVKGLRRKDPVSFSIIYFLATIFLVSNLLFAVGTHLSERFTYMPSVGYCLLVAVLLYRLSQTLTSQTRLTTFRQLYPALGLAVVLILLYSIRTVVRNPAWKNNYTLFTTDIQVSSNSAKLNNAVGGELITQAVKVESEARQQQMLQRAVQYLKSAIGIHPNYKNAYLLLGNAHYYLEQWDQAIQYYQQALELDAGYDEARKNLGIAYRDAGRFFGEQQGDIDRALRYLESAYRLNPDDYETARLLGVAHGISGHAARAIDYFSRALELEPDNPDALYNLGSAYYNAGKAEEGRRLHERAIAIDPDVVNRMRGEN